MQPARPILSKIRLSGGAIGFAKQCQMRHLPPINNKFSTTSSLRKSNKTMSYQGVIAAVFTPFTEDSECLALDVIPKYSRYLSCKGIKGVLVAGTNGEGMSMNVAERKCVTEAWIRAGHSDGIHVQVQVGGTNIKDVENLANHAESLGADSLLTLPELYYKPESPKALVEYVKYVAEAAPCTPIQYYHMPNKTNVNLNLVEFVTRAGCDIPTFSGIKFTDGDMIAGESLANLDPPYNKIFLGGHEIMAGAYILGFKSCTVASGNVFPTLCLEILDAVNNGKLFEAQEKQQQLNCAISAISQFGNRMACLKTATGIISGLDIGPTRFPTPPLGGPAREKLKQTLAALGVI